VAVKPYIVWSQEDIARFRWLRQADAGVACLACNESDPVVVVLVLGDGRDIPICHRCLETATEYAQP
jgi:hypothetical protein